MKLVTILRGIPGSGKSTYAAKCPNAKICSADHYFYLNEERKYKFDPTELKEAHDMCFSFFCTYILFGHEHIIVDNTNIKRSGPKGFQKYIDFAKKHDYSVTEVVFPCDLETAVKRNKHNVPKETIERMIKDFEV